MSCWATRPTRSLATLENLPAERNVSPPLAAPTPRHLPNGGMACAGLLGLGANMYLCGQEGAIDLMREALFENDIALQPTTLQATVAASLAIVLDLEGSPDEAVELSERAIRLLATPLGKDVVRDGGVTGDRLARGRVIRASRRRRHTPRCGSPQAGEVLRVRTLVQHPGARPAHPPAAACSSTTRDRRSPSCTSWSGG